MPDDLEIWTIFERPKDFPDHFVVRRFRVSSAGLEMDPTLWSIGDSLAEARASIPEHCTCLGREPGDEAQIVESWI